MALRARLAVAACCLAALGAAAVELPATYCPDGSYTLRGQDTLNVTRAVRKERYALSPLLVSALRTRQFNLATYQPYLLSVLRATIAFGLMGALALLAWPILCFMRRCRSKSISCCRRTNVEKGAGMFSRFRHAVGLAIFGICTFAAATQGLAYVGGLNVGVSGVVCEMVTLLEEVRGTMDKLAEPIDAIVIEADETIGKVKSRLDGTSDVVAEGTSLSEGIATFNEASLVSDLVEPQDSLKAIANSAKDATVSLADQVKRTRDQLVQLVSDVMATYQRGIEAGLTAGFCGSIFAVAVAMGSIFALLFRPQERRWLALFQAGFQFNWSHAVIGLLAGGLTFAPAYILSDACTTAYSFGASPRAYTSGVVATVGEGCLLLPSKPLLEGLGLADGFNVEDGLGLSKLSELNLPRDANSTEALNLDSLAQPLDWKDFGMDTLYNSTLATCCSTESKCTDSDFDNCTLSAGYYANNQSVTEALGTVQASAATVSSAASVFNTDLYALYEVLNQISDALKPLFDAVDALKSSGDCAYARDSYWALYESTCGTLLTSVLWVAIGLAAGGLTAGCLGAVLLMSANQVGIAVAHAKFKKESETYMEGERVRRKAKGLSPEYHVGVTVAPRER
ncbi:hypothetical protein T492DRAFT_1149532 [Pavlovales sp. CCMP2436]|nr:hypothetical protein T492DRAFT_1149532 [Pavlovales sp. CCMP2436]